MWVIPSIIIKIMYIFNTFQCINFGETKSIYAIVYVITILHHQYLFSRVEYIKCCNTNAGLENKMICYRLAGKMMSINLKSIFVFFSTIPYWRWWCFWVNGQRNIYHKLGDFQLTESSASYVVNFKSKINLYDLHTSLAFGLYIYERVIGWKIKVSFWIRDCWKTFFLFLLKLISRRHIILIFFFRTITINVFLFKGTRLWVFITIITHWKLVLFLEIFILMFNFYRIF